MRSALYAATGGAEGITSTGDLQVLPLAVPVLIFGTGMLAPSGAGARQHPGRVADPDRPAGWRAGRETCYSCPGIDQQGRRS